jgi:hypothetical protein
MNIMLVSVTERTFEIGLQLGAKRKQIMLQFLIESVLLSSFRPVRFVSGGRDRLLVGRDTDPDDDHRCVHRARACGLRRHRHDRRIYPAFRQSGWIRLSL